MTTALPRWLFLSFSTNRDPLKPSNPSPYKSFCVINNSDAFSDPYYLAIIYGKAELEELCSFLDDRKSGQIPVRVFFNSVEESLINTAVDRIFKDKLVKWSKPKNKSIVTNETGWIQDIGDNCEPRLTQDEMHSLKYFLIQGFQGENVETVIETNSLSSVRESYLPNIEWCIIPSGWVILESSVNETYPGTKGGKYYVSPFEISKYPITNAQFQMFLDDPNGYSSLECWSYSPEATAWKNQNQTQQNYAFSFKGSDLPRTNVSWYTANAFCQWLSRKSSDFITLPTEQQWQRAGQGDDNRIYPWGSTIDASRCNYGNLVGHITAVSNYPKGISPYGVYDMSGNIWEWTSTEWGVDGANMVGNTPRLIRGGSWSVRDQFVCLTYRYWCYPEGESNEIGFRCVRFRQL